MKKYQGMKFPQFKINYKRLRVMVAIFALFLMPLLVSPLETIAQTLEQKIKETEKTLQNTQVKRNSLSTEVSRLNGEIALSEKDIYRTTVEINKLDADITNKNKQIKAAEVELESKKAELSEFIRVMYEDGQASTVEIVAKSTSFNEFVNRSEYLEQVRLSVKISADKVAELMNTLNKEKRGLEENKAGIVRLKNTQMAQRNAIAQNRSQMSTLLSKTKGDESSYQKLLQSLYAERRALAEKNGEVVRTGGNGGYKLSDVFSYNGTYGPVDHWGFYVYQCTSYAAWNWNVVQGKPWRRTQSGNAWNWPALAQDQGYSVSNTPKVGAIAVWGINQVPGGYGHVAIVTSVYGGRMSVAEYNYTVSEGYGTRDNISYAGLKFIY